MRVVTSKNLLLFFQFILIVGCKNVEKSKIVEDLRRENDSLKGILSELSQKYIFDSITMRNIPSYQNTYGSNTNVAGEIVIVAFNKNEETNVIIGDSIVFDPKLQVINPDTLTMIKGGFVYSKKLIDTLNIRGLIEVGNKYGQKGQLLYNTLTIAKED
ncbi:hypothetical protein ACJD0Z_14420 [Flavobacteriaceae bacterium M23B6Z8]